MINIIISRKFVPLLVIESIVKYSIENTINKTLEITNNTLCKSIELTPFVPSIPFLYRIAALRLSPAITLVGLKTDNISPTCRYIKSEENEIFFPASPKHKDHAIVDALYDINEAITTPANIPGISDKYILNLSKSIDPINLLIRIITVAKSTVII